jgi:hypothetical protein
MTMGDNLQWKVGDVTITRVVETVAPLPPAGLMPSPTAEYADTDLLVLGTHYAPPCAGHLVIDGSGYRFERWVAEPRPTFFRSSNPGEPGRCRA